MSIRLNKVVVTGLGMVCPLGVGVQRSWQRVLNGECGIISLAKDPHFAPHNLPCTVAARVPLSPSDAQTDPNDGSFHRDTWVPKAQRTLSSPFIDFALCAASQALADSGFEAADDEARERAGVSIGSGIGCLEDTIAAHRTLTERGHRRVSAYTIPRTLINIASGLVSIQHGLRGPNHAVSTACASGAHSIGDAWRMIAMGDADLMVAGGAESCITPLELALFSRCKALSTNSNDCPEEASRPFHPQRDGFVMGEGAGCMVLESYEHALKRGARVYAELSGYGLSGDAFHVTAPAEDGDGAQRCMKAALKRAADNGVNKALSYVNAHATSTPLGDVVENRAIKAVFGARAKDLSVSSTKGAVGHMLGAAGAVEAIFTVLAVHDNVVPPTRNILNAVLDTEFDLDYVPGVGKRRQVDAAMTNSFGFGGTNASLVFSKV